VCQPTQSSIAVSADRSGWMLLNASHDIHTQINAFPKLQPGRAVRDATSCAALLMGAMSMNRSQS
jgi:pyrroloquinoline quinone biosynthesis protein B